MFGWLTSRKLRSAWNDIDANPRRVRTTLEGIARDAEAAIDKAKTKGRKPKPADVASAVQAWLGVQLCDIRLGKWDAALVAEKRWQKHGQPSPEDVVKLCETWFQESPQPLPDSAMDAYGRYFALPENQQSAELSEPVRAYVQKQLSLPDDADAARTARVIELAGLLYNRAPDVDWIAFEYGVSQYRSGEWQAAAKVLTKAVKSSPENPLWLTWQGRAEWKQGRRVIGRRALLKAHQLAPSTDSAEEAGRACTQTIHDGFTKRDGDEYVGKNPAEIGISLLLQATDEAPEKTSSWLALARGHAELKQYDQALQAIDRLVALKPDEVEAYCVRGEILLAMGKRPEARQALEHAQGINADSHVVARLAGDMAYDDGDYAEALQQYVRCPFLDWSDTAYRERLARCHLEAGQAKDVLEVTTTEDSANADLRLLRGRALGRLGRWDEALTTLETADLRVLSEEHRYYVAAAMAANQRFEDAQGLLNGLCDVAAWRDRARRQLGHIALAQNDDKTAEEFYVGEKNRAVTHEDLGRLLLARGKPGSASKHFAAAVGDGKESGTKDGNGQTPSTVARLGYAFCESLRGNGAPADVLADDAFLSPWGHEFRGHVLWDKHQFVDALAAYEKALLHRDYVPTQMLSRLAEGYLQLSRFREALPHLVELARRRPDNEKAAINLAYCRYHLGRKLFRRGSWETARSEWRRVRKVLEPVNAELAAAVGHWETEAAWRHTADVMQHERWAELPRTLEFIKTYRDRDDDTGRWAMAEGLAEAFSKNPQPSAAAFEKAATAFPDHASVQLGLGLSLQSAGQSAAAQTALGRVLELTTGDDQQLLHVASRFSAAMSHAAEKQWKEAATVLEPVIGHPLLQQSSRISDADVAQAVVAYYGLSGDSQKTEELAKKHLKGGGAMSDILIGVVQVDAGDYEGAIKRLSSAFEQEKNPAVRKILVSCYVCLAAESVLAGKLAEAEKYCKQALKGDRSHKTARRLLDAIVFAGNLGNLNMDQLDKAISQCEPLLKTSKSVQLIRTLAVLYHRHVIGEESRGRAANKEWGRCVLFWNNEIISSDRFWEDFCDDFNAGKKGREQIKPSTLEKLRSGLCNKMAKLHVEYLLMALDASSKENRKLHQQLIFDWDSDFEPTELIDKLRQKAGAAAIEIGKLTAGGNMQPEDLGKLRKYVREARDALEIAHKLAPERKDIAEEYRELKKACLILFA